MGNPGIITEQGYAAGSFGFSEATEDEKKKLKEEEEKNKNSSEEKEN